jgi:RsiW-degrading membrane proteinase PrsW (M82 family)
MATPPPLPSSETELKLSRSMVFPLVGGRSTWRQSHLPPIFVTLVAGIGLLAVPLPWPQLSLNGKPAPAEVNMAWQVFGIIALYIAFIVNYYINQMCGRAKPRWMIMLVVLFTFLMLLGSPLWGLWFNFFYNVIPGAALESSKNVVAQLAGNLFGTGLCEESFKALPLFGLALLGAGLLALCRRTTGRLNHFLTALRKRVAICEPLDGIVLGVASGTGFFMRETLGQYVPQVMAQQKYAAQQAFDGLVLLLARGLPDLAEHSAWTGLFGYFIGLSVLYPRKAFFLIPLGWLSAAALHGAWDGITGVTQSEIIIAAFLIGDGLLSYALLGGAIFKAREISPRLKAMSATMAIPHADIPAVVLAPATAPLAAADLGDWDRD